MSRARAQSVIDDCAWQVHGMWSSANARQAISEACGERVLQFKATFEGMVSCGETLATEVSHVGMQQGRLKLEVRASFHAIKLLCC